jgi:hypothetical protein
MATQLPDNPSNCTDTKRPTDSSRQVFLYGSQDKEHVGTYMNTTSWWSD